MLKHGGDTGFEEGKVHETDAAEVGFLLVFGDHFAEASDDGTGGRSKGHNSLVLSGDGEVIESKTGEVTAIARLLGEALSEGGENVVLSGADHGDTVLFVSYIAEFVDAFGGCSTLFSLFVHHGLEQLGNVFHLRRLGWGSSLARLKNIVAKRKRREHSTVDTIGFTRSGCVL